MKKDQLVQQIRKQVAKEIIQRLRKWDDYFDDPNYDKLIDDIAVDYLIRDPYTGIENK